MKLEKEQTVVVDLGYKFKNSIAKATFKQIIDVFEDGEQMIYCVIPFEIIQDKCGWAGSTIGQQMGLEKEQIIG